MAHRVLIVDDEESILFALSDYLQTKGYHISRATELEEAEALLACVRYDVVIVDLQLTTTRGAEGLEIADVVRERCPDTSIVVLTAYGSPEVEAEARRLGADAFLHKPTPLGEIERLIGRLVGARGSRV